MDDIIREVFTRIKAREKLSKDDTVSDIVFKFDEEHEEQMQLRTVIAQFNDLYVEACEIEVDEDDMSISSVSDKMTSNPSSWKNILDRIDTVYARQYQS